MKRTRAGRRGPARNSKRQPPLGGSRGPPQLNAQPPALTQGGMAETKRDRRAQRHSAARVARGRASSRSGTRSARGHGGGAEQAGAGRGKGAGAGAANGRGRRGRLRAAIRRPAAEPDAARPIGGADPPAAPAPTPGPRCPTPPTDAPTTGTRDTGRREHRQGQGARPKPADAIRPLLPPRAVRPRCLQPAGCPRHRVACRTRPRPPAGTASRTRHLYTPAVHASRTRPRRCPPFRVARRCRPASQRAGIRAEVSPRQPACLSACLPHARWSQPAERHRVGVASHRVARRLLMPASRNRQPNTPAGTASRNRQPEPPAEPASRNRRSRNCPTGCQLGIRTRENEG